MTQCADLIDPVQVRDAPTERCGDVDGYARAVLAAAVDAGLLGVGGTLPVEWVDAATASVTAAGVMVVDGVGSTASAPDNDLVRGLFLACHEIEEMSTPADNRFRYLDDKPSTRRSGVPAAR